MSINLQLYTTNPAQCVRSTLLELCWGHTLGYWLPVFHPLYGRRGVPNSFTRQGNVFHPGGSHRATEGQDSRGSWTTKQSRNAVTLQICPQRPRWPSLNQRHPPKASAALPTNVTPLNTIPCMRLCLRDFHCMNIWTAENPYCSIFSPCTD